MYTKQFRSAVYIFLFERDYEIIYNVKCETLFMFDVLTCKVNNVQYYYCCFRGSYPPIPLRYSADVRQLIAQLLKRNPRWVLFVCCEAQCICTTCMLWGTVYSTYYICCLLVSEFHNHAQNIRARYQSEAYSFFGGPHAPVSMVDSIENAGSWTDSGSKETIEVPKNRICENVAYEIYIGANVSRMAFPAFFSTFILFL